MADTRVEPGKGPAAPARRSQTMQRVQTQVRVVRKWLTPGLGIKRWLILLGIGISVISLTVAELFLQWFGGRSLPGIIQVITLRFLPPPLRLIVGMAGGLALIGIAFYELNRSILAPFGTQWGESLVDAMHHFQRRNKGSRVVAIGGGTGLPAVLRGIKSHTTNITAIVTVADDGGSSGKLRRELGVLPPGDLRNNIAALANDEHLMTQLLQYRFDTGGLEGHAFGNLFLTALANITGSMDQALVEAGRVLAIEGQVLPSTLADVILCAEIRTPEGLRLVKGESQIPEVRGAIERVYLEPASARPYPDTLRALLNAELIVIGPGSLFTSILPNLLVEGIREAIRASSATCVYVCNIATQKGETEGFSVSEHVHALEKYIGEKVIDVVLANSATPSKNAGEHTHYVPLPAPDDPIRSRYQVIETDLTDPHRPWRHSPVKLNRALLALLNKQPDSAPAGK